MIRLLDDPGLVQAEIDRRRNAARNADPLRKREEDLRREQARVEKSGERLVTAYREGLVTLAQLRQRMPALQKQTQAVESELQSLKMAAVDEAKVTRSTPGAPWLARTRLHASANVSFR
jgi:site-specific DNA recombinase